MAKYYLRYDNSVNFICISVEGFQVAQYFGKYFTGNSINITLLDGEGPPFPLQLGCFGFVVINENAKK